MFIASENFRYNGKIPAPGMILKIANCSQDKDSGMVSFGVRLYASLNDYLDGDVFQQRAYDVRIYAKEARVPQGGPGRGPDQTLSLNYCIPEVVRCWGGTPVGETLNADADWPNNLPAQCYALASTLPDFKDMLSDEDARTAIASSVGAAVDEAINEGLSAKAKLKSASKPA
jgi:hypothetical protein